MLTIENNSGNIVEATISGKITAGDITNLQTIADNLIAQHGRIKVLGNASKFEGWENITAMEKHITFVKDHQEHVERVAIIAGYTWQHWFAAALSLLLKPEIKVFDSNEMEEARKWLGEN